MRELKGGPSPRWMPRDGQERGDHFGKLMREGCSRIYGRS